MKVVVIGATGTIGKALVTALTGRHEVIRATRRLGLKVDIEDPRSIQGLFNAGLEGFVLGASVEMPRGLRVNLVSPPRISETLTALKMDPSQGISAEACAKAYVAAVEGKQNGQTLDARKFV
jgi:NAD(P)-dependent dehydrogenase (short-subunit alcohol dehydrogenase family)